jgi:hypothetical protein
LSSIRLDSTIAVGWGDAYPRTEKLHVVERYKRVDFGHLEVQVTIEDPGVFLKPWHFEHELGSRSKGRIDPVRLRK